MCKKRNGFAFEYKFYKSTIQTSKENFVTEDHS